MKNNKKILILSAMIISQVVFSQVGASVVSAPDVTAVLSAQSASQKANHISTYAKITAQLAKMEELNKMYDQTMKYVKVVNSLVSNSNQVAGIKKEMDGIINEYKLSVLTIQNEPLIDLPSKQYYLKGLGVTMDESLNTYGDIYSVLSEDMIMNDAERLRALTTILNILSEQRNFIHYVNSKIKSSVALENKKSNNTKFLLNENKGIYKSK